MLENEADTGICGRVGVARPRKTLAGIKLEVQVKSTIRLLLYGARGCSNGTNWLSLRSSHLLLADLLGLNVFENL